MVLLKFIQACQLTHSWRGSWIQASEEMPEAKTFPEHREGFLIIRMNTRSFCIYFYQLLTKVILLLHKYAQKTIALILQVFCNHFILYFLYVSGNIVIWGTIITITM